MATADLQRAGRMTSRRLLPLLALLSLGARAGEPASLQKPASLVVEGEDASEEPSPPIPQADERRIIGDYIRDNSAPIRECYEKRLRETPTLQGKLLARFDIGPNGRVSCATNDEISDRELVVCAVIAEQKFHVA